MEFKHGDIVARATESFMQDVMARIAMRHNDSLTPEQYNRVFEAFYHKAELLCGKGDAEFLTWEQEQDKRAALHAKLEKAVREGTFEFASYNSTAKERIEELERERETILKCEADWKAAAETWHADYLKAHADTDPIIDAALAFTSAQAGSMTLRKRLYDELRQALANSTRAKERKELNVPNNGTNERGQ